MGSHNCVTSIKASNSFHCYFQSMFKWESNKVRNISFSLILIFSIWIQIEKSNEKDIYDEDYVDNDPAEASVEYYEGSGSMKEEYAYDRDYEKHFDFLKKMFHMYPMIKDRLIAEEIAIQQFKYYLQALILELKKLNFARYHM